MGKLVSGDCFILTCAILIQHEKTFKVQQKKNKRLTMRTGKEFLKDSKL